MVEGDCGGLIFVMKSTRPRSSLFTWDFGRIDRVLVLYFGASLKLEQRYEGRGRHYREDARISEALECQ